LYTKSEISIIDERCCNLESLIVSILGKEVTPPTLTYTVLETYET